MSNSKVSIAQIDALLPQTQCGECGYPGCRPYAKAIAEQNEGINLCPPGGISTLQALASLLQQDPSPYLEATKQNTRPPAVAKIREAECIGCTKCIKACPVDAVLGSGKQMHSIIATECTGCELCIPACPVDCIDLLELEQPHYDRQLAKQRYDAHNFRLARDKQEADNARIAKKRLAKQKYVQAALNRVKAKKT